MRKKFRRFLAAALLLSFNLAIGEDKKDAEESFSSIKIDEVAPAYDRIVPLIGWERYLGDSARSIREWARWWKYLRLQKPIVMKWIDDFVLRIYPCNEVFRSIFVRGIYDPNLVATVNTLLPKGGVLMDVGANMGYVSILASQIIGKEGHIFAIEPSSRDFSRLKDNVRINRLDDVISCYNFAVSEKNGRAKLLIAGEERSALNTLGSEISFKGVEEIGVEEVETSTLDSFVEKAGIKRVDVLKMDVEGSELKALQGARNTIETYRPAIILGVNRNALKSCGTDYPELQKMIGEIRYYAYKIVEKPTFALEKIKDLSKNYVGNVVCLHESVVPPILPQPEKRSIWDGISYFFLR